MLVDYRTFSCGKESSDREACNECWQISMADFKEKGTCSWNNAARTESEKVGRGRLAAAA